MDETTYRLAVKCAALEALVRLLVFEKIQWQSDPAQAAEAFAWRVRKMAETIEAPPGLSEVDPADIRTEVLAIAEKSIAPLVRK